MEKKIVFLAATMFVLSACGGGGGSSNNTPNPTPTEEPNNTPSATPTNIPTAAPTSVPSATPLPQSPTFAEIQSDILMPNCTFSGCHTGSNPPEGLRLDSEQTSFDNLVNVVSGQRQDSNRVTPNNAQDSYLIRKLEGRDIENSRMPLGRTPLASSVIQEIRDWIDNGAPRTGTGVTSAKPSLLSNLNQNASLELQLHFSKPLDEESLTEESIQIVLIGDGIEKKLYSNEYVSQNNTQDIVLLIPRHLIQTNIYSSLKLTINNPSISAIYDIEGRIIDGNKDGVDGGAALFFIEL